MSSIRIHTDAGRDIKGNVAFDYRGHVISLSTYAFPPEILIFLNDTDRSDVTDDIAGARSLYGNVEGIREAMHWIDKNVEAQSHAAALHAYEVEVLYAKEGGS